MTAAGKGVSPPYLAPGLAGESSVNRASFLGPRIPPQVEAMAKSLQELEKEIFRKLLKGKKNQKTKQNFLLGEGTSCSDSLSNCEKGGKMREGSLNNSHLGLSCGCTLGTSCRHSVRKAFFANASVGFFLETGLK